jgi:Spy/CpxP family protein refolding chaperone
MATSRRARLLGMAMLAGMFVAGALAGAATMQVLGADEAPALRARGSAGPHDLLQRLDLTPEQRVQIDAVLERRRAEMEEFWDEHRPALRGIADAARAELRAVLTPEQQAVEQRFLEERSAEEARRRQQRGRGW